MRRREFLVSAASALMSSAALAANDPRESNWVIGVIPDTPFTIELVELSKVPRPYWRTEVEYRSVEKPGTIIVDAAARHLYLITSPTRAVRYGIAVGREGAAWKGTALVGRKARWPTWTPTANMRKRNPKLPVQVKGGPFNPLGARALYLFQDGVDTLYRIHGTNEPWSIGKAASSGCIRMLNEDVFELYGSVAVGAKVIVK